MYSAIMKWAVSFTEPLGESDFALVDTSTVALASFLPQNPEDFIMFLHFLPEM